MADCYRKLETSRVAMSGCYPALEYQVEEIDNEPVGVWNGWLQPIRSRHGLNGILCDLDADREILIDRETASIAHSPKCKAKHAEHGVFNRLRRPDRPFRVRIEYNGGSAHPRAWLLDPIVTLETRRHMFGENRICAYSPQTNAWRAENNTVADFTDHVLVWAFKWNTWVETNYWPGSEEGHDPMHLLSTISPEMQCWCGAGKSYSDCCRSFDHNRVAVELRDIIGSLSPLRQVPSLDVAAMIRLASFVNPTRSPRSGGKNLKGDKND